MSERIGAGFQRLVTLSYVKQGDEVSAEISKAGLLGTLPLTGRNQLRSSSTFLASAAKDAFGCNSRARPKACLPSVASLRRE